MPARAKVLNRFRRKSPYWRLIPKYQMLNQRAPRLAKPTSVEFASRLVHQNSEKIPNQDARISRTITMISDACATSTSQITGATFSSQLW